MGKYKGCKEIRVGVVMPDKYGTNQFAYFVGLQPREKQVRPLLMLCPIDEIEMSKSFGTMADAMATARDISERYPAVFETQVLTADECKCRYRKGDVVNDASCEHADN